MVAIAKEHGKELTLEQAQALLDRVKNSVAGELSDDAVEAVAGGRYFNEWFAEDVLGIR